MDTFHEWKVGYGYNVIVTYINHPKSFFVRLADHSDLMDIIERPGSGLASLSTGQTVVYKSKILKKFVRGRINYIGCNKEKVTYDIYAVDYGCVDRSVSARHIHPPDSIAVPQNQCPGLATHCRLHLCEPKEGEVFSEEVIHTMRRLVDKEYASINVINKISNQLVVELINAGVPRDVASFLGMVGLTVMVVGPFGISQDARSSTEPVYTVAHSSSGLEDAIAHSLSALNLTQTLKYKHKQLNVGDIMHVRLQSGTSVSSFYVAEVDDFKTLRNAEHSFSQYVKSRSMKDEDFVAGRLCAVKLNNFEEYERAKIIKVNPNSTAILELVDWGKEVESKFTSIRSIDNDFFLNQPIIAIYCSTTQDQVQTTLPSFFLKGFEFTIKIIELGNNSEKPHKVNIYPLVII